MESPDYEKIRQASILAMLEKTGCPDIIGSWLCSVADTSAEATCYTKEEDDMYKKYAVEHPLERVFKVCNPKTGLPDEVYTACVIERYREYHSAKRNEPVLKRHRTEEKVLCWYCRPSARNYCG
ncbi:uncharacterized protein [Rutidosis leptorrhynchoides]|uniref:uncharacterized protein isoform X2 n=1 Tax=Rutidosis leptorrhynchoides TaxID=125765 RepID=UPI003A9981A7